MTKDEYVKTLEKYVAEKVVDDKQDYYAGYFDGLKKATELSKELDELEKVVIPKFIADWIRETAQPSNLATISVMNSDAIRYGKHIDWFKNHDNQRLLLKALLYGYEVEKEKKYLVKIKGICQENEYLNCEVGGETLYFELDSSAESEIYKTNFTKQWLKDNFPEYEAYNNAGLLEFEEVEDD